MGRGSTPKGGRREERMRRKAERAALMAASADNVTEGGNGTSGAPAPANLANVPEATGAMSIAQLKNSEYEQFGALKLYKPGQGYWVRMGTAMAIGLLALLLAQWIYSELSMLTVGWTSDVMKAVGPGVALALGGWGIFAVVGRSRRAVDFFIATEGEMKKVNWSTRKEVIASTKVVLMVTILLTLFLAFVDTLFRTLMWAIGVLRIKPYMFGL